MPGADHGTPLICEDRIQGPGFPAGQNTGSPMIAKINFIYYEYNGYTDLRPEQPKRWPG
jgi:hypothetical protein